MYDYDDNEEFTHVPAPTPMDWLAAGIVLALCVLLVLTVGE